MKNSLLRPTEKKTKKFIRIVRGILEEFGYKHTHETREFDKLENYILIRVWKVCNLFTSPGLLISMFLICCLLLSLHLDVICRRVF